ncbi:hypothetical protein Hanom_Chr04g00335821 [Helianthus anomalus]
MGYTSHVNDKYLKSRFCRPYKFMVHSVVQALSHRKGAYNETSDYIMNIITCLVLSRPYNILQVLFNHMVDNIKGDKYIMYPRFVQMLLDDQVSDLQKDPTDELKLQHMSSKTLNRLNKYKGVTEDHEPRIKAMICKIKNTNYVAPENDAWRHEDSNSKDETACLSGMHEKKLRYWFVRDGKRKRTPKVSPTVTAPKVTTPKIVIKGKVGKGENRKEKSPIKLIDEPVVDPTELIKQGADLLNMTSKQYIKHTDAEAAKAAVQGSHVEKVAETSSMNIEAESVKEKEAEGAVHTDSSTTESDTEPEFDTSELGVGKIKLKVKPLKKKNDSDEEDSTYIPTPEDKKKPRRKRKAHPSGVIPRNVRARKGAATMPEIQSGNVQEFQQPQSTPEVEVQSVKDPDVEVENVKAPEVETTESPIFEKVEKLVEADKDDDEVEFMGERESTPPPPPVNPTIHIPDDPQEPSSAKKDNNSSSSQGFPTFLDNLGLGPVSLDEIGDLFNEGKINLLTKRVSILEKTKKKAEVERDELKEKLKKVYAKNEELKKFYKNHAEIIDDLNDTLAAHAKVIDTLTSEFDEVKAKYKSMNEVNKTLHQMIGELHETSSNENKVLR